MIARECNEELAEMMRAHPDRFTGLASVPMQDVPRCDRGDGVRDGRARIPRASRSATTWTGACSTSRSSGRSGARSKQAGAVVFFHQCSATVVESRTDRYGLPNTIGNLTERAITFGTLVFGGVMDEFPDLKICLGHAGGYTAFGVARMDKGWRAGALEDMPEFEDARTVPASRRPAST